jgi:hypothetical protein
MIRNSMPNSPIQKGDIIAFNHRDNLMRVFDSKSDKSIFWDKAGDVKFIDGISQFILVVTLLGNALGLSHKYVQIKKEGWNTAFIFE